MRKNVDDDLMIVKDSVRRWLKSVTVITQTTGTEKALVDVGDFTSLPVSALHLLTTTLSLPFQLILASSIHKVMPNDKPFLARKLLAREWRRGG